MKLTVAIPSRRDQKPQFVSSLLAMNAHITQHGRSYGIETHATYFINGCSLLPEGRRQAVNLAKENGSTWVLMVDDDMAFPVDTAKRLISHNVPIVGVNYPSKDPTELKTFAYDSAGKSIISNGKSGLEQVLRIGFGVVLIRMDALNTIPEPHFEVVWDKQNSFYVGEDYYFCKKAVDCGAKLYVDHDLSKEVAHIGDYAYTINSYK